MLNETFRKLAGLILVCFCCAFCSCSATDLVPSSGPATAAASSTEVIVFAAASLQETLDEIQNLYRKAVPEVTLVYNLDSSGTLKTQIEEGAACDLFISAAPKQMNELEEENLIQTDTRVNLLENKVVLVVPEGNPAGITGWDDLAMKLRDGSILCAIGNSDVPVGQYTEQIFAYLNLNEEELAGSLTYGSNVKEVTEQVSEGAASCGIIYATDAYSAGLDSVSEATEEMCGMVIYPAALIEGAGEQAREFLDYLKTSEAMAVFESVGFVPAA